MTEKVVRIRQSEQAPRWTEFVRADELHSAHPIPAPEIQLAALSRLKAWKKSARGARTGPSRLRRRLRQARAASDRDWTPSLSYAEPSAIYLLFSSPSST